MWTFKLIFILSVNRGCSVREGWTMPVTEWTLLPPPAWSSRSRGCWRPLLHEARAHALGGGPHSRVDGRSDPHHAQVQEKKHFIRKRVESDEKGTKSLKAKSVTTRELFSSLPSDNLIYGRMWKVSVATVFTTHATMLGRYRLQNNCTVYKTYTTSNIHFLN